jgi:hypothetical protein
MTGKAPAEQTALPGAPPFDSATASAAFTAAEAQAQRCFSGGRATVSGRISVAFAHTGEAKDVSASGDLANAAQFTCVRQIYAAVRVPAYSGAEAVVKKSVTFTPGG